MEGVNEGLVGAMELIKSYYHGGNEAVCSDQMSALLYEFGIPVTADNVAHMMVMMCAMTTYAEREEAYGGSWREFGATAQAMNLARKAKRAWVSFTKGKHGASCDDALDAINYGAFLIRAIAEGNIHGNG